MNDETVSYLRKLKDGNGVYLWQPALQQGQPDKLLGYDIYGLEAGVKGSHEDEELDNVAYDIDHKAMLVKVAADAGITLNETMPQIVYTVASSKVSEFKYTTGKITWTLSATGEWSVVNTAA